MTLKYVNTQKEVVKENMTCSIHIEINKAIVKLRISFDFISAHC